ncbi:MAG: hypothetical protein IJU92_07450 [Spirochaetaceae bacterium]|nr:hypothetical protein [Spirochaetaceae bacterium]
MKARFFCFASIYILCVFISCATTRSHAPIPQTNRYTRVYGGVNNAGVGAYRVKEIGFDGTLLSFDDLIEFEITEPNFDKKFLASPTAKFPFDDSYKQKVQEIIYFLDSKFAMDIEYNPNDNLFFAGLAFDKVKSITDLANYDINSKKITYTDVKRAQKLRIAESTHAYTSALYSSKNNDIIDGAFFTQTWILYYPKEKFPDVETEWQGMTFVYPISFIYDNASRISEITVQNTTYKFSYPNENAINVVYQKTTAGPIETWTFDTMNHSYIHKVNSTETTGSYPSIEPKKLNFVEKEVPHAEYDYSFFIHEYDKNERLKIYATGKRKEHQKIDSPTWFGAGTHGSNMMYALEY